MMSRGGRPHTSRVRWWMSWRTVVEIVRPRDLGDHDHRLLALVALHTERDHVAGAHAVEPTDGPLDVFGEHVAAADDDDVLDPAAQRRAGRRGCRRGRRCTATRRGTAPASPPHACSSRASPRCRGAAARRRDARAAPRGCRGRRPSSPCPGTAVPSIGSRRARTARSSGSAISTGLATRVRSSTSRSTVSHIRPAPRRGNEPPIAVSAMPKAGNTAPASNPNGSAASTNASTAFGSTGSAPRQRERQRRQVEARSARFERPGREHPREVRSGGRGAADSRRPSCIQLPGGHEVLRGRLHEVDTLGHRERQEPDEAHVVVQRQPRDHRLADAQLGGLAAGVDVRRQHTVGDHHALRLARRTAGVLEDDEPLRVVRGQFERSPRRDVRAPGSTEPIGSIGGSPAIAS